MRFWTFTSYRAVFCTSRPQDEAICSLWNSRRSCHSLQTAETASPRRVLRVRRSRDRGRRLGSRSYRRSPGARGRRRTQAPWTSAPARRSWSTSRFHCHPVGASASWPHTSGSRATPGIRQRHDSACQQADHATSSLPACPSDLEGLTSEPTKAPAHLITCPKAPWPLSLP